MIEWTNVRAAAAGPVRQTLHQNLVERIGQMIQDGELPPGERLSEAALCAQFDVSRTPLREALKVLASEGYLVWPANRGITVAEIQVGEVRAAFDVLAGLEQMIGDLAAVRATPAALLEVERMHADMVVLHQKGSRPAYFRLNQVIHGRLARLTGNAVLEDVYGSLQRRVYRARALSNTGRIRWTESVREHEAIMVALRKKDGPALATALVAHSNATMAVTLGELIRLDCGQKTGPATV